MGKKIKGWVPPEEDEVVVETAQEYSTQKTSPPQSQQQWTPPAEDEVITDPVKKKESSTSVSSSDSKDLSKPSGKNTQGIQLSEEEKRILAENTRPKTKDDLIAEDFKKSQKKQQQKQAREFVTGEKESQDVLSSFTKTIQSGVVDQLPKEYYTQRLRMSKGSFGDLYDSRSDLNAYGGDKFHEQLPAGTSIGAFKEWSLKQPSAIKSKTIDERAKIFLTEKLGAKGFEDLKSKFAVDNLKQRLDFEKNIEEQNLEAGEKLQGVVQDLKSVSGASDFLSFAGNMLGQAIYRAPVNILSGSAGSIVSESAATYDRQIDLIAQREGISRAEVINKGLDKPAEGQALAVLAGTLDAASEFNLIGLFRKAAAKQLTQSMAKQFAKGFVRGGTPEALTEVAQGELEEIGAAKGADVEYSPDAWRMATSAVGGIIGGGIIGGGANVSLTPQQQSRPTKEFVEDQISSVAAADDIQSVERAADAIDAKVQAADENTITKEEVKEEEVVPQEAKEESLPTPPPVLEDVDQKSGGIIPIPPDPKKLPKTDDSVSDIKDKLVAGGKILTDEKGELVVKQNSGYPSQLFDDLSKIIGDKKQALNEYLKIKNDQGEFKKKFGDWENQIMKEYGQSGHEYTVKRASPEDADQSQFSWTYADDKGNPIIIFNDKKIRRESDFTNVKKEYEQEALTQSEGSDEKKAEYAKLYDKTINKLRDLKLHLIHQSLIKKQKGSISIDDNIKSIKEIERLNSIDLAKDYYGEPMIFMHSGAKGITKFLKPGDKGYDANDIMTGGAGIYFTRSPKGAGFYSRLSDEGPAKGMDIYYVFLKTKNPYYMSDPRAQADYPLETSETIGKKDAKELMARGYDSIIWDKEGTPKREMVVFDPSQIEIIGSYRDGFKTISESGKEKTLLNRAHKGDADEDVKKAIEKHGLNYEVESHASADKAADRFIKDVGIDKAIEAVRKNQVDDGAAAFIWAKAIDDVGEKIASAKSPDEIKELTDRQAELIDEFDKKARSGGRFISALQEVYRSSDFGYKSDYQVKKYKEVNNGKISPDVEAKFKDLDKKLQDANEKIKKLEESKSKLSSKESLQGIRQDLQAQKEKRAKVAKERKEKIDNFFDSLKVKNDPGKLNSITQVIGEAVWNGSVEVMRKAVMAGADVATAIQAGIDYINEHYRGDDFNEEEFRKIVQPGIEKIVPSVEGDAIKKPSMKDGKLTIPNSIIRQLVEAGAEDIDELTQSVHDLIKNDLPDVSLREVRDAITKYGETRTLSQDDINVKIREIRRVGKLVSALEDVQNKLRPLRSGLQRDKLTDQERRMQREIKEAIKDLPVDQDEIDQAWRNSLDAVKSRLKNQISDLEDQIKNGAKSPTKKGIEYDAEANSLKGRRDELKKILENTEGKQSMSDEQKTRNAVAAVQKTIDDYERRIAEKDFSKKEITKAKETAELKALRDARDKLKDAYKQLEKEMGIADKKRAETVKKGIKKSISRYEERIKNKDFAPAPKKAPLPFDKELNDLKLERDKIKAEFDVEQEKARRANRTLSEKVWDTAVDVWNIPKSLLASIDMSAPFRQGAVLSISNPKAGAKSFHEMFRQAFSENKAEEWLLKLRDTPEYQLMKQSKLYLAEPNTKLTAKEENFLSNFAGRIPVIGRLVKGSERAYTGYLNKLRVDVFVNGADRLMEQGVTPESNPEAYKALASFINNATGRGNLGALENAATVLNGFFFSPRYLASRVNLLNPVTYAKMPKPVRIMALKSMISYIGFGVLLLSLAAAAGADVEHDPRSSDFGKMRIGNMRYDIWAGFQQVIRFIAQVTTGERKSTKTGKITKLDGKTFPFENRGDVVKRFFRSKLSPSAGTTVNLLTGEDMMGNEVTIEGEAIKSVIPLYLQDVNAIYQAEGATGLAESMIPSFFGIGVQNYEAKKK